MLRINDKGKLIESIHEIELFLRKETDIKFSSKKKQNEYFEKRLERVIRLLREIKENQR